MLFSHLINLLYPNLCIVCNDTLQTGEKQFCVKCFNDIPRTNFHLQKDNVIEQRFWGKVKIERATSFFIFQKGSNFQKLIHSLKYKGNKEIGVLLGKMAAIDLLQSVDFTKIDFVIPVPLHEKKLLKRGYNQSDLIGEGVSSMLKIPLITNNLYRKIDSETQTKKGIYERYENMKDIFDVRNPKQFENKHLLLVDDVLTTGSTLEGCIFALNSINNCKVSVFTLAVVL